MAGQSWVGPGAWVDLGPAPVAVTPMAGASVYLQQGASAPANTSAASLVGGASTAVAAGMTFAGTQHVFAIGAPGALQVQVDVEAVVAAASTPAIASDGGGMAHITNWPSVFAVTWSGQSVAISNWPTTQAVSWSGQSVAATQSGVWNVGLAASFEHGRQCRRQQQPRGLRGVRDIQAPIEAAAAQIVAARTGAPGTGRISVTLYNFGSATVFIGASGVGGKRPAAGGARFAHDRHHGCGLWRRRVGHANRRRPGELLMRFKSRVKRPLKALEWGVADLTGDGAEKSPAHSTGRFYGSPTSARSTPST